MLKKSLTRFSCALFGIVAWCALACADVEGLASYELSLAGYSLGMSFDDAPMVRPFHRIDNLPAGTKDAAERFIAIVEQEYINDVEMDIKVCFLQGYIG